MSRCQNSSFASSTPSSHASVALRIRDLERTISFRRLSFSHFSLLFEIDVPVIRLPLLVFQCESEDGVALLDRIFSLGIV